MMLHYRLYLTRSNASLTSHAQSPHTGGSINCLIVHQEAVIIPPLGGSFSGPQCLERVTELNIVVLPGLGVAE